MHGLDRKGHVHRRRRHDLRRRQGRPDDEGTARADDRLQRDGAERLQRHREPPPRRVPRARGDEPARAADPWQPLAGAPRRPEPGEPLALAPAAGDRRAHRRPLARRRHDHARRGPRPVAAEPAGVGVERRLQRAGRAGRRPAARAVEPRLLRAGAERCLAAARARQRRRRRRRRDLPQWRVDPHPQPGPAQRGPPRRLVGARLGAPALRLPGLGDAPSRRVADRLRRPRH